LFFLPVLPIKNMHLQKCLTFGVHINNGYRAFIAIKSVNTRGLLEFLGCLLGSINKTYGLFDVICRLDIVRNKMIPYLNPVFKQNAKLHIFPAKLHTFSE
jgi:hypothetical protein